MSVSGYAYRPCQTENMRCLNLMSRVYGSLSWQAMTMADYDKNSCIVLKVVTAFMVNWTY